MAAHIEILSSVYYSSMSARARASTRVMYASDPERKTEFPFLYPLPLSPSSFSLSLPRRALRRATASICPPPPRRSNGESGWGWCRAPSVSGYNEKAPYSFAVPLPYPLFFPSILSACVCPLSTSFSLLSFLLLLLFLSFSREVDETRRDDRRLMECTMNAVLRRFNIFMVAC